MTTHFCDRSPKVSPLFFALLVIHTNYKRVSLQSTGRIAFKPLNGIFTNHDDPFKPPIYFLLNFSYYLLLKIKPIRHLSCGHVYNARPCSGRCPRRFGSGALRLELAPAKNGGQGAVSYNVPIADHRSPVSSAPHINPPLKSAATRPKGPEDIAFNDGCCN